MCKSHFKSFKAAEALPLPVTAQSQRQVEKSSPPPPPCGESVYDSIIAESIAWCPRVGAQMPLIAHLKAGFDAGKPPGWHRNEERRARGLWPVTSPATHFDAWERELVWTEILILTGNSQTSFRHLARAWGRDKGFQAILAQFICERKGSIARKANYSKAQRPLGDVPKCVEITTTTSKTAVTDEDPNQEDSSTTTSLSATANDETAGAELWGESFYYDVKEGDAPSPSEQFADDIFMFPPSHQHNYSSLHFDSAMIAEIDRDAAAIIATDEENENNQKRPATSRHEMV